jgi:hypothetical protein
MRISLGPPTKMARKKIFKASAETETIPFERNPGHSF